MKVLGYRGMTSDSQFSGHKNFQVAVLQNVWNECCCTNIRANPKKISATCVVREVKGGYCKLMQFLRGNFGSFCPVEKNA